MLMQLHAAESNFRILVAIQNSLTIILLRSAYVEILLFDDVLTVTLVIILINQCILAMVQTKLIDDHRSNTWLYKATVSQLACHYHYNPHSSSSWEFYVRQSRFGL